MFLAPIFIKTLLGRLKIIYLLIFTLKNVFKKKTLWQKCVPYHCNHCHHINHEMLVPSKNFLQLTSLFQFKTEI